MHFLTGARRTALTRGSLFTCTRSDAKAKFCIAALLMIAALPACSGGGGAPASPVSPKAPVAADGAPPSASSQTRATFVVHWPSAAQSATAARRRHTLSPSTQSISVSVNGGAGAVVNKPTLTGSPSSTSVSIVAPAGSDQFTFTAWDHLDASGNVLDQSTVDQTIVADTNNTVSVVLDGVCSAFVASLAQSDIYTPQQNATVPLPSGTRTILTSARLIGPATRTLQLTRVDADGNTVLTSGDVSPISLLQSGSPLPVTIAPVAAGPSNTTFTLTPLAGQPDGSSTTIRASTSDCGSSTQPFPTSFQISTSAAVLVADFYEGILAYDQDGTQLGTAPISTTKLITGIAYSPKSGGYLVAIEGKSGGGIAFQTLSLAGTTIASSSFTPHNDPNGNDTEAATESPANVVFDAANGNFYIALQAADSGSGESGTVEEYAISGATTTFVQAETFAQDPYCLVVLPSGNLVNNDYGNSNPLVYDFTNTFSFLASYAFKSNQTCVSYDSTRGTALTLNSDGTSGSLLDGTEFNLDGTFTTPPAYYGAYFVSVYSPSNDELYLFSGPKANGLSGATVAQGGSSTSNLVAGAFPGLSLPTEALVLP
jgi:hypothetical protein